MKDKELIKMLKDAYSIDSTSNKTRFIRSIKKPNVSLLSFIGNQFKLISHKIYISCLIYLLLIVLLLLVSKSDQYILFAAFIPFFSLFLVFSVNTSRYYCMEEMEMATLFSLKMVILARMVIMAFIAIVLIGIATIFSVGISNISFILVLSYFYIPYFLNMFINLKILQTYRDDGLKYCFVTSSLICLLILYIINNPSLILFINSYVYLIVLFVLVILSIKEGRNYVNRLEENVWNLH